MISFVAFSLRRAWQGFWRNAVMSLAATATMIFMLVLLSGFFVLLTGLNAGLEFVEQKVEVVADVKDTAPTLAIQDLATRVRAMPEVASVEYVNAAEALQRFRERLKAQGREDLTTFLDTNPLPGSLQVKLKDPQVFGNVVEYLRADPVVERVKEVQNLVDRVLTVTELLRTGGLIVLALVGIVVLFIIVNTIRLAVVARAEEIEIMRLVGASDAFIRWPFIFEGALVGLIGALVTLGLLALGSGPMGRVMTGFFDVLPLQLGTLGRDLGHPRAGHRGRARGPRVVALGPELPPEVVGRRPDRLPNPAGSTYAGRPRPPSSVQQGPNRWSTTSPPPSGRNPPPRRPTTDGRRRPTGRSGHRPDGHGAAPRSAGWPSCS